MRRCIVGSWEPVLVSGSSTALAADLSLVVQSTLQAIKQVPGNKSHQSDSETCKSLKIYYVGEAVVLIVDGSAKQY